MPGLWEAPGTRKREGLWEAPGTRKREGRWANAALDVKIRGYMAGTCGFFEVLSRPLRKTRLPWHRERMPAHASFHNAVRSRPPQELPVSKGVFIPDALARRTQSASLSGGLQEAAGDSTLESFGDTAGKGTPTPGSNADTVPSSHHGHPAAPREAGRWYHFAQSDDAVSGGGIDGVEFLLSAGPGEPLRPLASVASGGESARVMLALKAAPSLAAASTSQDGGGHPTDEDGASPPDIKQQQQHQGGAGSLSSASTYCSSSSIGAPVLILDELDSSIGARLGSVVGRILRRMCSSKPRPASGQIICVTHLPQVGAPILEAPPR
jgi:hypothetical protein